MPPALLLVALAIVGYHSTPLALRRHYASGPALRGLTLWFILCSLAVFFFATCYRS